MHRKLLPALGASAIFLATVLNAAAAPLDPATSSKFTADEAALAQDQVVAVPTTSLLQGLYYTTSYTRLQQILQAQGWFPGPQTQLLQLRAAAYDDLGYDIGYGPVGVEAGQLAERAFDY
jgi:hypothetical protein